MRSFTALLSAALLAACASPTTPAVTPTAPQASRAAETTTAEAETATAEAEQPIPGAVCADLRDALVQQMALDVSLGVETTEDPITGTSVPGCQLSANGSAAELGAFPDVASKLRTLMTGAGWSEDQRYQADGPTGTASGYRKNNVLARTSVQWQLTPDASCPTDQPISACQLTPAQQQITIQLDLSQP